MRIVHPILSEPIVLEEGTVSTIVMEAPAAFRDMVLDLWRQCNGNEGQFVLSRDFQVKSIAKEAVLIMNPLFPDLSSNKIKSKLYKDLEQISVSEDFFSKTYDFRTEIRHYLTELLFQSDIPLAIDEEISLTALLKAVNLRIDMTDATLAEQISSYLDIMTALKLANLFIFVNLKSYLSDEEIDSLYQMIKYKKYRILLLESSIHGSLRVDENVVVFDKDLCEIVHNML